MNKIHLRSNKLSQNTSPPILSPSPPPPAPPPASSSCSSCSSSSSCQTYSGPSARSTKAQSETRKSGSGDLKLTAARLVWDRGGLTISACLLDSTTLPSQQPCSSALPAHPTVDTLHVPGPCFPLPTVISNGAGRGEPCAVAPLSRCVMSRLLRLRVVRYPEGRCLASRARAREAGGACVAWCQPSCDPVAPRLAPDVPLPLTLASSAQIPLSKHVPAQVLPRSVIE